MQTNYTILAQVLLAGYVLLFVLAAVNDVRRYRIPNVVVVALVVLFVPAALCTRTDVPWLSHFGAAAVILCAGAVAFYYRILGAGDVKLLTAAALWSGFAHLGDLLLCTAILGGALALLLSGLRYSLVLATSHVGPKWVDKLPSLLMPGAAVPYGVAIAAGAIWIGFATAA